MPAAAKPAVTRSETRRRKPSARTAANDNTQLRAKCHNPLSLDSCTSQTTLSGLQLDDDADGSEQ